MEKLLRDLNIYAHSFMNCNLTFTHDGNRIRVQGDEIGPYVAESIILNKKFGFIKWLVENDKIDIEKVKTLKSGHNAELFDFIEWLDGTMEVINYHYFEDYEQLLMLLAISDTSIEDLISYLK